MSQFQPGISGNPAGRPRKTERYAAQSQTANDQIALKLPALLKVLLRAALDGSADIHEDIDEEWVPAILVTKRDSEGGEMPQFTADSPEVNADGMVCVKRRVKRSVHNRAADVRVAADLLDRILGKAVAEVEAEGDAAGDHVVTVRVEYIG